MTSDVETPLKIALHACCGPCLLEPYDALVAEGDDVVVVYFNPNIHPREEYERRRNTLVEYAAARGIPVVELPYEPGSWLDAVGEQPESRQNRCRACYRLRIGAVARWAAANGYDAVASTLTVSPYQDAAGIAEEAKRVADEAGVTYIDRDFRDRYADATRRSRELGMYRQNYCGCLPSEIEARIERETRRRRREAGRR